MATDMIFLSLLLLFCVGVVADDTNPSQNIHSAKAVCPQSGKQAKVYKTFWKYFDRKYAVFEQRLPNGTTWFDVGRHYCSKITKKTNEKKLCKLIMKSIRVLNDGHSGVEAESLDKDDDGWTTPYIYQKQVNKIEKLNSLRWTANDLIGWGSVQNTTYGYVVIKSFEYLSGEDASGKDRRAAREAMEELMPAVVAQDACIVDIRGNEGGWDSVARVVASIFTPQRQLVWKELRRIGRAHSALGDATLRFVESHDDPAMQFYKPVVLLTSGGTFSAAETFGIAMNLLPHVSLVGERSSGHFSYISSEPLPNGWRMYSSNRLFVDANGDAFENVGLPVDVAIPFDDAAYQQGRDVQLEGAIAQLNSVMK